MTGASGSTEGRSFRNEERQEVICSCVLYCHGFPVFLISEILCSHWVRLELKNSYNNTPYRKEAILFLLSAPGMSSVDLTEAAQEGILSGCAVLRYNDESYGTSEVIYCDQGVIGIHGLETLDFLSGKKAAVAGADSGYGIGDTVTVNGLEYPVEGILERHISIAVNTGVFYSRCDLSHVKTQGAYVLTARDRRRIVDAYAQLEELVKGKGAEIRSREMSRVRFSDYVDYRGMTIFLFGVLGIFYIGLIGLFAYIWLRLKKPEIHVLNLLGYMHIRRKVWMEYSAAWLATFLLSLGAFCAISRELYYSIVPILGVSSVILLVTLSAGYAFFKVQIIGGHAGKEAGGK